MPPDIVEVDKSQKVITTGLYSIVRHPCPCVLIMYIPAPVALGSYWGLIPMLLFLCISAQNMNEEKVLSKDLPVIRILSKDKI